MISNDKAKLSLRSSRFFRFLEICLHFQLIVCNSFLKKLPHLNHILAFSACIGSNMHCFRAIAIWNRKISNKTLCSTGWPKSKFANSNGYNSENTHFWPHVVKSKMCFGCLHLFLKIVNKQLKNQNKYRRSKHILVLPI